MPLSRRLLAVVTTAGAQSLAGGQSAPLYLPDDTETKKAGNRRVEIRLVPYRG